MSEDFEIIVSAARRQDDKLRALEAALQQKDMELAQSGALVLSHEGHIEKLEAALAEVRERTFRVVLALGFNDRYDCSVVDVGHMDRILTVECEQIRSKLAAAEERARAAESWKAEAIAVESEWDAQAIAKMLGGQLGQSCRKVVAEKVPQLLAEVERLRHELLWVQGASDCKTDPIVKGINEHVAAVLAVEERQV